MNSIKISIKGKKGALIDNIAALGWRLALLYLVMVGVMIAASYGIKMIDSESLRQHALESELIIEEEQSQLMPPPQPLGEHLKFPDYTSTVYSTPDYFTDAIIISSTACRSDSLHRDALGNPIWTDSNFHFSNSAIKGLQGEYRPKYYYSRYWHGYTMFTTPALIAGNIWEIREMNLCLLWLLFAGVTLLIWTRLNAPTSLAFIIAMLGVGFQYVPYSMQYCTCFYIMLTASATLLLLPQRHLSAKTMMLIFFAIGGLTSYLDFLTTPLLTFGIPAVLALLRRNQLPDWRFLIGIGLCWGAGYAGIWIAKWVVSAIFTDLEIFREVFDSLKERTGTVDNSDNGYLSKIARIILAGIFVAGMVALRWWRGDRERFKRYLPLGAIAFLPFLWIGATINHSLIHYWFVWRIYAVSIFSIIIFLLKTRISQTSNTHLTTRTK